ncbi:hypothetical protein [Sorangium sp. So ce204]|uniref:hypothetical protein n=1 Tax=Sorangium sp. So ce204 TaxID=3133288 RepID=UPI003F61023A
MRIDRIRGLRAAQLAFASASAGAAFCFAACSTDTGPTAEDMGEQDQNLAACSYAVTTNAYEGAPEYWGTIKIKNTGTSALKKPTVAFDVPDGVTCDHHEPGWTHTQAGSRCTYSRTSNVSIARGASFTLNFSTDSVSSFTPSRVELRDTSCSSSGSTTGGGSTTGTGGSTTSGAGSTTGTSGGTTGGGSTTGGASTTGAGGGSTTGGASTTGAGGGSTTGSGGGSGGSGVVWQTASLTEFESYPDPGSEECIEYNGCTWAGQFAALDGKQPESWVRENNIAAVHSKDFERYKLKTLRLRKNGKEIDVKVYDMCADSDCSGCCTRNAQPSGYLIDIEKYTAQRFGVPASGQVEWRCLDCN